jgi:hypothetical protein
LVPQPIQERLGEQQRGLDIVFRGPGQRRAHVADVIVNQAAPLKEADLGTRLLDFLDQS